MTDASAPAGQGIVTAALLDDRRRDPLGPDQGQEHRLYRRISDRARRRSEGGARGVRRRGGHRRSAERAAARFNYVFTTGGIGPTHDDITADSVAKAFGVPIDYDPEVVRIAAPRFAERGTEMNEARMRMARIPKGAALVNNKVSAAPGFWLGNVIVMAGVPAIMQAMLDEVAPKLKTGVKMLSETVCADAREGDIGTELGEIAKAHPEVTIGSYPYFDEKFGPNTNVVIRSRDPARLAEAKAAVEAMLVRR